MAALGAARLMTAWMIEEYIEDFLWLSSMLQQSLGRFTKQAAAGKGPLLADALVTGAGWEDPYYVLEITFSLPERWQLQLWFSQARIPILITDNTIITVEFEGCTASATFPASEAHTLHSVKVRTRSRVYRVNGKIIVNGVPVNTWVDVPLQVWLELDQHVKSLKGLALVNKAEELYRKATDELKAIQRLWDEWLDDNKPSCELEPEIRTRMKNYNTYAQEWLKAYREAISFIYTELPELKPPKTTMGLPVLLEFEKWPPRSKLQAKLDALASQAETIAASVSGSIEDLKAKAQEVLARIEAIAKNAVADIVAARKAGKPQEEIEAIKATAKARILAEVRAFAKEAESTLKALRTAQKQIASIEAQIKYLTCQGPAPSEYVVVAGAGVTPV